MTVDGFALDHQGDIAEVRLVQDRYEVALIRPLLDAAA